MHPSGGALIKEEKSRRVTEASPTTPIQIEMIADILPRVLPNEFRYKSIIEPIDKNLPQISLEWARKYRRCAEPLAEAIPELNR